MLISIFWYQNTYWRYTIIRPFIFNIKYIYGKVHKTNIISVSAHSHYPRLASRVCLLLPP